MFQDADEVFNLLLFGLTEYILIMQPPEELVFKDVRNVGVVSMLSLFTFYSKLPGIEGS